jgi:DNA primase
VGGVGAARGETGRWLEAVREMAARPVAGVVTELAVQPLPITEPSAAALLADPDGADRKRDYVRGVIGHLLDQGVTRQIALLRGRLNRLDATQKDQQQALLAELMRLEARKRELRPDE